MIPSRTPARCKIYKPGNAKGKLGKRQTDQSVRKPIEMPPIALRNTAVCLFQAGLRTHERNKFLICAFPYCYSGLKQMGYSFTVAGAVLALLEFNQSAPASRLSFKEKLEGT